MSVCERERKIERDRKQTKCEVISKQTLLVHVRIEFRLLNAEKKTERKLELGHIADN